MENTTKQINAGLEILKALADTIRQLRSVPSGELYARVMGHMDINAYDKALSILKGAGLIAESNAHMLTWVAK